VGTYRDGVADRDRVRFWLTWSQRRWFVGCVVAFELMVVLDATLDHGRLGGGWGTGITGLVLVGMAVAMRWVGTSLTQHGAVLHAVPSMTIPWADVHEIEVETQLGISTVVIHHGEGRRTRLNAPTTGPLGRDDEFQDKVRIMRTWWAAHRRPDVGAGPAAA
jgi:hypothetical protein